MRKVNSLKNANIYHSLKVYISFLLLILNQTGVLTGLDDRSHNPRIDHNEVLFRQIFPSPLKQLNCLPK